MTPIKLNQRIARLMPRGVPRYVRCYETEEIHKCGERYTVCFTGHGSRDHGFGFRGMSADPFHPQGIGMWGEGGNQPVDTMGEKKNHWYWPPAIGRKCHVGKRIKFTDLPADCQRLVIQDYKEIWKLNK